MEIKNVKGTHDIYGKEGRYFSQIEGIMKSIADLFAFEEVRTPVLEHSEVFVRGVGESSDVVRKEMYTLIDKGGRSLTLRPEFTAGVARMVVQNKLLSTNELPLKLYYCGPLFRYERPQLGRYRQFNQFGVESLGHDSYLADIETITMAYTILNSLGLNNVSIKINTLGDEDSRNAYRTALRNYFAPYIKDMCPDCQSRFEINPLRILDCKVLEDIEITKNAPRMSDFLSNSSKERFNHVLETLKAMEIPYEIDDTLVRGLDYYSETVFEFRYVSQKGNDYGAIGGGGHYDKLISELGGPSVPGVGFSFGVERLYSVMVDDNIISIDQNDSPLCFYVMPIGESVFTKAHEIANSIRVLGYSTDICFDDTKLSSMFKRAEKKGADYAIIIGEDELSNNQVVIKRLKDKKQTIVDIENIDEYITSLYSDSHCDCDCHEPHECTCGHHHENEKEHHCCCHKENKE